MTGLTVVLFVVVGVLMLTLRSRMDGWACLICGGRREHHPKCPRRER